MTGAATQGLGELQRTALPNGLRVVTMRRPGALLAGVKLFFKVGSRDDGESSWPTQLPRPHGQRMTASRASAAS